MCLRSSPPVRRKHKASVRPWYVLICGLACWTPSLAMAENGCPPANDGPVATPSVAASSPSNIASALAMAQPHASDIDLLDLNIPMVVTATRHEEKVSNLPYAVSVITAEDIRRAGAHSIPDALRLAPGVDVAALSYGNYAVSPRGFHDLFANKTLVLVDGRQIFDPVFGGTLWGNWPFQMEDIKQIEVIRGPAGLTWGPNAANGVINIITKDPADQKGLTATAMGGSRGTTKDYAGYGYTGDKVRMRVSGEYERSDGFDVGGSFFSGLHDDYQAERGSVKAILEPTRDDTVTLYGGGAVLDGGWPVARLPFQCYLQPAGQANYLQGNWEHRIATDNTLRLTGYVNDFYSRSAVAWSDYRYEQFALQLGHTFKPAEKHTLTWGIDTRLDLVNASGADPYMLSQNRVESGDVGIYAQDEWRFAPKWTLSLGGRVDYDCYGGFQPSGRVSLSREINNTSMVYGAVSRAFQMPPGAYRFLNLPIADPFLHITVDRDIQPTTLIAYEAGYRGHYHNGLSADANVFWHHYDDLGTVRLALGPPALLQSQMANGASLSTYGFEAELKYALTKTLTLLGNYTFEQPDTDPSLTKMDAITMPRHKFMVGVQYDPIKKLHLSSYLYFVDDVWSVTGGNPISPTHIPAYYKWDLRAEYELTEYASVAVGVQDLLDNHHPEGGSTSIDYAEVPRVVYGELRVRIK